MEPQQAHRRTALRCTPYLAAVAGLLLGPAALGASNNIVDCDKVARELQSQDVDADALALDAVEHVAINEEADFDLPASPVLESDAVAPVLFLTPRVATILREVFDSDLAPGPESGAALQDSTPNPGMTPVPPVAKEAGETSEEAPVTPSLGDETATKFMPGFQRQMYRTDI